MSRARCESRVRKQSGARGKSLVAVAVRVAGVVLLVGGVSKLYQATVEPVFTLAGIDLPRAAGAAVGIGELAMATVALSSRRPASLALPLALLFAAFFLTLVSLSPGEDCGCLGPIPVSATTLKFLDLSLAAALLLAHVHVSSASRSWRPTAAVLVWTVLAAGAAAAWVAPAEPQAMRLAIPDDFLGRPIGELVGRQVGIRDVAVGYVVNSDCLRCVQHAWNYHQEARKRYSQAVALTILDVGHRPERVLAVFGDSVRLMHARPGVELDALPWLISVERGTLVDVQSVSPHEGAKRERWP